jgi:predicted transcriptional regulator
LQVQLAQETTKKLKEERSAGGEIATMKNEIHKMEMRLSHLRRIQEKLIHDMESCVARRDVILYRVMNKFRKDPKERHNQKVIFKKRLADQKLKMKQIAKVTPRESTRPRVVSKLAKDGAHPLTDLFVYTGYEEHSKQNTRPGK